MFRKKKVEIPSLDPELLKRLQEELKRSLEEQPVPGTCKTGMPFSNAKFSHDKFCGRRTLDGQEFCYWHFPDARKYSSEVLASYFGKQVSLAQALEEEVAGGGSLENAFLQDCRLGGDFLHKGPNLTRANFLNANLRGAWMSESNLTDAIFVAADLTKAKLSSCLLSGANFHSARLFDTKFRSSDIRHVQNIYRLNFCGLGKFGIPVDRMLEEYPEQAMPMYRALVSYFSVRGQLDDASWAAYRASRLQHRILSKQLAVIKANQLAGLVMPQLGPVQAYPYIEYLSLLSRWLKSGLFLLITGYGEKPGRVVIAALILIFGYCALYCTPGAISGHGFYDALYFSIVTFATLGYGDILPCGGFRLVAGSEALCGILFTGLFIFCLGRKTVSRG